MSDQINNDKETTMATLSLLASITSILVNLYTLWSVRKTLIQGAKNAAEEAEKIIKKI